MSFLFEGKSYIPEEGETVLEALLRHGQEVKHRCKVGACQSCLLRGKKETVPGSATVGLSEDLVEQGYFLSCKAPANTVEEVVFPSDEVGRSIPAVVTERTYLSDDVVQIKIKPTEPFTYSPGLFVRLEVDEVARSYSIASGPNEIELDFHIRLIPNGQMSEKLVEPNLVGKHVSIAGPYGTCRYRATSPEQPLLMIGSGTGLAPLYAILLDAIARDHQGKIVLYHGAATPDRLYFQEELTVLSHANPQFEYIPCADEGCGDGVRQGSPLSLALEDHPNLEGWRVYTCGHPALVNVAKRKTYIAGADLRNIHADPFEDQSGK